MISENTFQKPIVENKPSEPSHSMKFIAELGGQEKAEEFIDKKMAEAKNLDIEIGVNSSSGGYDFTIFVLGKSAECMSKEKINILNQLINGMANEIDDVRSGLAAREPRKTNNTERTKTEKSKSELAYAKGRQKKIEGEARMLGIDEDEI